MARASFTKQKAIGIVLVSIVLIVWWLKLWERYVTPNRVAIIWSIVIIALLVISIALYGYLRDKRLLETVTSPDRGTATERDLVLRLLKYGLPSNTIYH